MGNIGGTLTRRLAALGHAVSVANSRGPDTLRDLAVKTGATAVSVTEAGSLDESWRQQPGTPVYTADLDADGVRRALSEASPERPPQWRATPTAPAASPTHGDARGRAGHRATGGRQS